MEAHARSTEKLSPPRPSILFGPVIFEMSPLESRGSFGRVFASNWTAFTEKTVAVKVVAYKSRFERFLRGSRRNDINHLWIHYKSHNLPVPFKPVPIALQDGQDSKTEPELESIDHNGVNILRGLSPLDDTEFASTTASLETVSPKYSHLNLKYNISLRRTTVEYKANHDYLRIFCRSRKSLLAMEP